VGIQCVAGVSPTGLRSPTPCSATMPRLPGSSEDSDAPAERRTMTKDQAGDRLRHQPSAARPSQTMVRSRQLDAVHSRLVHLVGTRHRWRTADAETRQWRRQLQQQEGLAGSTGDVESAESDRDLSENIRRDSAPTTGLVWQTLTSCVDNLVSWGLTAMASTASGKSAGNSTTYTRHFLSFQGGRKN